MSITAELVEKGIATIEQAEDALGRQVLYGGDLLSNLLDVAHVDEGELVALASRTMGLSPGPSGPVGEPPAKARELLPPEIAEEKTMFPLAFGSDDRTLLLAVSEKLSTEDESELGFALGISIEQRLVPYIRIREALRDYFGVSLERREERLLKKINDPSRKPAPRSDAQRNSDPKRTSVAISREKPEPKPTEPFAFARETDSSNRWPTARTKEPSTRPAASVVSAAPDPVVSPEERLHRLRVLGTLARQVRREAKAVRPRGPLPLDRAREELFAAEDKDAIFEVVFGFTKQYFDFTALFAVSGELAEGRDAYGPGTPRDKIVSVGIPLDVPSVFATARAERTNGVRAVSNDSLDPMILADLGRLETKEAYIGVSVVRDRVVAILWGDMGKLGIDRGALRDVDLFLGLVGSAFERLILRKKGGPLPPPPAMAPVEGGETPRASAVQGLAALSKAVGEETEVARKSVPPPRNSIRVSRPSGPPIPREDPSSESLAELAAAATGGAVPRSVPPRKPPSSERRIDALPSVMVDLDGELRHIVVQFLADPSNDRFRGELMRQGTIAIPFLMERFPGPVNPEPTDADEQFPSASSCGPLLSFLADTRRIALLPVLERTSHHDERVRFWSSLLLSELAYPEAIGPLLARLADSSVRVKRAATRSLVVIAKTYGADLVRQVQNILQVESLPVATRIELLRLLCNARAYQAIPTFLEVLSSPDANLAEVAETSLSEMSLRSFGRDPKKWAVWWGGNSGRHRIEWLIDALTDEDPLVRTRGGDELKEVTKTFFGYYADLPRKDREKAQAKYREWWQAEGKYRFGR